MPEDYRLFVNEDRTILVRWWPATDKAREWIEVAMREQDGDIWGPPVLLEEDS